MGREGASGGEGTPIIVNAISGLDTGCALWCVGGVALRCAVLIGDFFSFFFCDGGDFFSRLVLNEFLAPTIPHTSVQLN